MKTIVLAAASLLLALSLPAGSASAQRRRRAPPPPPPAELAIESMPSRPGEAVSPFLRVLTIRALAPLELAADRRLLRLEVRADGARRPVRCEHPDRPARVAEERIVQLDSGETWSEWIDLREYCWGRALDALRSGAEVSATFGPRARGRGRFAIRAEAVEHRELGPATFRFGAVPPPEEPDPESEARVVMSSADALSGRAISFRVAVLGRRGTRRAYVRTDRVSLRVHGPAGDAECSIARGGGAVSPDLFQRLTPRAGARLALDGAYFCADIFRNAGVYEVVPVVDLEQDGEAWGLRAITGRFVGAPALVRIRRGERGYVERPIGDGPS